MKFVYDTHIAITPLCRLIKAEQSALSTTSEDRDSVVEPELEDMEHFSDAASSSESKHLYGSGLHLYHAPNTVNLMQSVSKSTEPLYGTDASCKSLCNACMSHGKWLTAISRVSANASESHQHLRLQDCTTSCTISNRQATNLCLINRLLI